MDVVPLLLSEKRAAYIVGVDEYFFVLKPILKN